MGIRVSVLGLALSCDGCRKPPHPWGQRISGELLELQVSPPPRGESVSPGISSLGKNLPPRLMAGLHTSWRCFFPVDVWLSILLELRFWLLVGWFFCGSYHGKSHFLIHFFGRMCFFLFKHLKQNLSLLMTATPVATRPGSSLFLLPWNTGI